jgi:hypothetical protein
MLENNSTTEQLLSLAFETRPPYVDQADLKLTM